MPNSIKTNFAAQTALQSLNSTNKALDKTQSRISTGYRVNEAADNAAYWAISSTLRSDNSALSTVSDSLGLGAGQVDVAYTAITSAKTLTESIRDKLISAKQDSIDKDLVALDITQLKNQLITVANGASFSGQNWLIQANSASTAIVSNYSRNTNGTAVIGTIGIQFDNYRLFSASTGTGGILGTVVTTDTFTSASTQANIDSFIADTVTAINSLTKAATDIGSVKSRIGLQQDFVKSLRDAIDRGVSTLVDADLNEESTRLQALQTQQQLGVQSLSIANQSTQSILRLFQ